MSYLNSHKMRLKSLNLSIKEGYAKRKTSSNYGGGFSLDVSKFRFLTYSFDILEIKEDLRATPIILLSGTGLPNHNPIQVIKAKISCIKKY
jgi:hypothetical protein